MPITLNGPSSPSAASSGAWGSLEAGGNALAGAFTALGQMAQHWDQVNSQAKIDQISWQADSVRQKAIEELRNSEVPPTNWGDIVEKKVSDFVRGNIGEVPIGRMADDFYGSVMKQQQSQRDYLFGAESEANQKYITNKMKEISDDDTIPGDQKIEKIKSLFYSADGKATHSSIMAFGPYDNSRKSAMSTGVAMVTAGGDMKYFNTKTAEYSSMDLGIDPLTGTSQKPFSKSFDVYMNEPVTGYKAVVSKLGSEKQTLIDAIKYKRMLEKGEQIPPGTQLPPQEILGLTEEQINVRIKSVEAQLVGKQQAMEDLKTKTSQEMFNSIYAQAQELKTNVIASGKAINDQSAHVAYIKKWLSNIGDKNAATEKLTDKDMEDLIPKLTNLLPDKYDVPSQDDKLKAATDKVLAQLVGNRSAMVTTVRQELAKQGFKPDQIEAWNNSLMSNSLFSKKNSAEQLQDELYSDIEANANKFFGSDQNNQDRRDYVKSMQNMASNFTQNISNSLKSGNSEWDMVNALKTQQSKPIERLRSLINDPAFFKKQSKDREKIESIVDYNDVNEVGSIVDNFNIMELTEAKKVFRLAGGKMFETGTDDDKIVNMIIKDPSKIEFMAQSGSLKSTTGADIRVKAAVIKDPSGKQSTATFIPVIIPTRYQGGNTVKDQSESSSFNVRQQPGFAIVLNGKVVGLKFLSGNNMSASKFLDNTLISTGPDTTTELGKTISRDKQGVEMKTGALVLDPVTWDENVKAGNYQNAIQAQISKVLSAP